MPLKLSAEGTTVDSKHPGRSRMKRSQMSVGLNSVEMVDDEEDSFS